jgi:glycerol-3-phosphate dehydrogenase
VDSVLAGLFLRPPVRLKRTKGVHLLTDRLSGNALVLFARRNGRLFFVIPWQQYSLVGTTDTYYQGDLDRIYATPEDAGYLYSELRNYLPGFGRENIYHTSAGVRTLVGTGKGSESRTPRAHRLVDHEGKNGISGLITVLGGKITAYRRIAEETVDLACLKLGHKASCTTGEIPLPSSPRVLEHDIAGAAMQSGLTRETAGHLACLLGSRFRSILKLVELEPRLGQPVCPGYSDILAQVRFSVEEEYALTAADFLLRRTDLGLRPGQGLDALDTVVAEMGALLGWSTGERARETESYRREIELTHAFN